MSDIGVALVAVIALVVVGYIVLGWRARDE
jgi:hypothetical protein